MLLKKRLLSGIFLLLCVNVLCMRRTTDLSNEIINLVQVLENLQQVLPSVPAKASEIVDIKVSKEELGLLEKYSETIKNMTGALPEEEEEEFEISVDLIVADNKDALIEYLQLIDTNNYNAIANKITIASLEEVIDIIKGLDYLAIEDEKILHYLYDNIAEQLLSALISGNPDMIQKIREKLSFSEYIDQKIASLVIKKENLFIVPDIIEKNKINLPIMIDGFKWSFDDQLCAAMSQNHTNLFVIKNVNDTWNIEMVSVEAGIVSIIYKLVWNSIRQLAIASAEGLWIWDTGIKQRILEGYFKDVQWSSTNEYLATARSAQEGLKPAFLILNKSNNTWLIKRQLQFDRNINFSWSPSGRYLAYLLEKKLLYVWDSKKDLIITLGSIEEQNLEEPILWSRNDNYFIAGKKVWALINEKWESIDIGSNVKNAAWNPKKDSVAFLNYDGSLSIARVVHNKIFLKQVSLDTMSLDKKISSISWNATGNLLALGADHGHLYLCYETSDGSWSLESVDSPGRPDPIIEISWSVNNFLAARTEAAVIVFKYEQNVLKLYFTYEYTQSFNKLSTLAWSVQGTYLGMIHPNKKEDKGNFSIYDFSLINELQRLSLDEAFVYVLKKRNRTIPAFLNNVSLPSFLEKTLK